MIKKAVHIAISIFSILSFKTQAQDNIPVFGWQTHFSYENIISLTAGDGKVFAAANLGIFYVDQEEISRSYVNSGQGGTQLPINELLFANDSIYAATDDGILSALNSNSVNLQDFNNWQRKLTDLAFTNISTFDNELYASSGSDIFLYDGNEWIYFASTVWTFKI